MYASSSFVNPTPLAHADTPRDILPRGRVSQLNDDSSIIHTDSTDRTIIHTTTMNSIPQSDNQHLYDTMHAHLQAYIQNSGGCTSY
ncbi:hypothetical protein TNCV_2619671 [Trichonephila clavipes]|uniref:Uncharacterized protein n=1 Tax=Trichonephila clavipes TaxID=2585209 RepID=A0A8X6WIV2_TRICX|nr:hypothetical protein TNCV_2619671 [Trichonephila clavipes]